MWALANEVATLHDMDGEEFLHGQIWAQFELISATQLTRRQCNVLIDRLNARDVWEVRDMPRIDPQERQQHYGTGAR